jgi:hypothetical protein
MPINRIDEILHHFGYGAGYDLTAVPISEALSDGAPLRMVRHRPEAPRSRADSLPVRSGACEFAVNPDAPWCVEMREAATGRKLPGAVAVYPERIDAIVPHPDGVLIRFGRTVGKITPNTNRRDDGTLVFTYSLANQRDLELAGVSTDQAWPSSRI